MKYSYKTSREVCSDRIEFEITDDGILENVVIHGGCNGNSQGVAKLAEGRPATDVVTLLSGIRCGRKKTSCPDQLANAVSEALKDNKEQ